MMWEPIKLLLITSRYIPHGHCYLWQLPLVSLHLISDLLIGIAYFSIPMMLIYFIYKRNDLPFSKVFVLFSAFIILCGTGHFLDILTLWYPAYWLTGIEHALTALVSCYTAIQLVNLLPQFLSLRSPEQLEVINQALEKQIAVSEEARQELQQAEQTLKSIMAGTAAVTGDAFFVALVQNLASMLNVRYVFIAAVSQPDHRKTLVFWADGQVRDNFEYSTNQVCEETSVTSLIEQARVCCLPNSNQAFTDNHLEALAASRYIDVPLLDGERQLIGVLGIADQSFANAENAKTIITIFAARAAAELQRKQAETALRRAYDQLEDRVQERTIELVRANNALRENEAKFRTLVANIPGVVYRRRCDSDWPLEFVSESILDLTGYPASEFTDHQARTTASLIYPEDIARVETTVREAIAQKKPYFLEYRLVAADGSVKWIYEKGQALFEDRHALYLDGTLFDITDRKQAEAALTASQDFLNRVLNAVADPIFVKDRQHRWMMLNDAFCQMMGCTREALLGELDHKVLAAAQADALSANDNQVFASRLEHETEEKLTDAAGTVRTLLTKKIAFTDAFGNQSIVGIMRDISDRKRIEAALWQALERERAITKIIQRMRQSLDLETIFSSTTQELRQAVQCDRVLVYRFQPDWSGELVSESVAEGWRQIVAQPSSQPKITQVAIGTSECAVKQLNLLDGLMQDTYLQTHQGGFYREENSYRCVSDVDAMGFSDCYLELLAQLQARAYLIVPIFCGNQLWGLLAAYQNAGPRQWQEAEIQIVAQVGNQLGVAVQQAELFVQTQQQAAELKAAKEAADAANRAKSEFLANMSHELRTPLNAVIGFTQLMERTPVSAEHQQYLGIISRSGEHLLTLVNDILEMARIEAGRISLNEGNVDLYQLLSDLKEMLSLKAESKQLRLIFECDAAVPQHIRVDEQKLRQVLINLLSNAVKFTERGSIWLRTRITRNRTQLNQCWLQFSVEDTGLGIAADEQGKLFQVFEQTQTGLNVAEGTGLGLPISQRFVQLMGGEITVKSQPGQGSQFSFEIPVRLVEAPLSKPSQLNYQSIMGLAPDQPSYRILIAEDNADSCLLLLRLLSSFGFEVRAAKDGQEAVAIWQSWQPHLIWMDIQMPVMDGYEATRQIKATDAGQATVIIALTASAFEEQRQEILAVGCDDFIRKPFRKTEILEKIAAYLPVQYLKVPPAPAKTESIPLPCVAQMPREWVEQLYISAAQGNDSRLLQLIQQIPGEDISLAQSLTELVENFCFEQIMMLAQSVET